jgi:hypothetical protein
MPIVFDVLLFAARSDRRVDRNARDHTRKCSLRRDAGVAGAQGSRRTFPAKRLKSVGRLPGGGRHAICRALFGFGTEVPHLLMF